MLVFTDFSITSPIISPCPTELLLFEPLKNKRVGTNFSFVSPTAVPVSGQILVLQRSDGSSPQASCHLSPVFPSLIVSQAPSSREP